MNSKILMPVIISLKVALATTVLVAILGVSLGVIFTKYKFKGKSILETIILLPMCLPPTVVGYGLLLFLGKNGPFGRMTTYLFGKTLVFTWQGAAVGAAVVALPLMYQSAKAGLQGIDKTYIEAARIYGAGEMRIFFKIILPLAFENIASGIILSFTRALGEFGASLMLAGNIPGKTQTIPIAIYFAMESGDKTTGGLLALITIAFSFILVYWLNTWTKIRR